MATKKTTKKAFVRKSLPQRSSFFNFFTFSESYTSLILGIVVVIIATVLLLSFFKNRNVPELQNVKKDISATRITPLRSGRGTYTVKPGDNLWSIAETEMNDGFAWKEIAKANNITNPEDLEEGAVLTIPKSRAAMATTEDVAVTPEATVTPEQAQPSQTPTQQQVPATYTVVKGDDLWSIAVKVYNDGYKWSEIARVNNLVNPDIIHPGNTLQLPR